MHHSAGSCFDSGQISIKVGGYSDEVVYIDVAFASVFPWDIHYELAGLGKWDVVTEGLFRWNVADEIQGDCLFVPFGAG